jgi:hypothetical protein
MPFSADDIAVRHNVTSHGRARPQQQKALHGHFSLQLPELLLLIILLDTLWGLWIRDWSLGQFIRSGARGDGVVDGYVTRVEHLLIEFLLL